MNEAMMFGISLATGAALGALFFVGLWWTIRRGATSANPALLFFVSLWLRLGIVLAGFHFVARGHGGRLAACLLGFILARLVATRLVRTSDKAAFPAREVGHAPQPR